MQTRDQQIAALKRMHAAYTTEGNTEAAESAAAKLAKLQAGDPPAAADAPDVEPTVAEPKAKRRQTTR